MSHEPLEIANKVILTAREKNLSLTIMQLIKLVYIAHGWTLALLNKPLINRPPEAWQHGPVYPDIYNEFRGSGPMAIDRTAKNPFLGSEYVAHLSESEEAILEQVVDAYGSFHAFELSRRTHQPGTPWNEVYRDGSGKFQPIGNDVIKTHFDQINQAVA